MNAIVMSRITEENRSRIALLGHYDASDLQRAMKVAIGRAHLRALKNLGTRVSGHVINCDVRPDGRRVEL